MLRRFAAASFAIILLGASQPPSPSSSDAQAQQHQVGTKPQDNAQTAQDHQLSAAITETAPNHQPNSDKTHENGSGDTSKNWWVIPDWWLVGFTGVLTIATIALGVFTYLLWISTRRAVSDSADGLRLANETYIAAHRPSIVVRGLFMFAPTMQRPARIIFKICNTGESAATICEFKFYMHFHSAENELMPIVQTEAPAVPSVIEAGYDIPWSGHADINLIEFINENNTAFWTKGEPNISLKLRGTIVYTDAMKRRRNSSFHRYYDFKNKCFRRIEGSEFEYAD